MPPERAVAPDPTVVWAIVIHTTSQTVHASCRGSTVAVAADTSASLRRSSVIHRTGVVMLHRSGRVRTRVVVDLRAAMTTGVSVCLRDDFATGFCSAVSHSFAELLELLLTACKQLSVDNWNFDRTPFDIMGCSIVFARTAPTGSDRSVSYDDLVDGVFFCRLGGRPGSHRTDDGTKNTQFQ